MKIISELSDMIEEELEGAENYITLAHKMKEANPSLSKVFHDISLQEMNHVDMLHGEVVKLIQAHREEHGEPPAPMMAVYEYLHGKHIEKANKIRLMQNR